YGTASFTILAPPGTAPTITMQPISQSVVAGQNASFTLAATGSPAPRYQWQSSSDFGASWLNLFEFQPYSGTTTATLTVMSVLGQLNGRRFRCLVTNVVGSVTSNAIILSVNFPPAILTHPANRVATH